MIVAHVINCLDDGGAEAVLYRLCLADHMNSHVVISLQTEGKYGHLLKDSGIAVHCLDMPRGLITPSGIWRLARLLRNLHPDVIQTWMYHANLVGGLIARTTGITKVYWGIRRSDLSPGNTKAITLLIARLNALLSHSIPYRIISCSQRGVEAHQAIGYAPNKFLLIPNGYDLKQFTPSPQARETLRKELGVQEGIPLLGMVARFNPLKDHHNLLAALGLLRQRGLDFRCILTGSDMTPNNTKLHDWLHKYDLCDQVQLLGQRNDIPALMNALDIHVLSSASEGFPNVLCEAMACGTPCVTTDAGDAALIVGDTGWVVPTASAELLADALSDACTQRFSNPQAWQDRQKAARLRILEHFSIEKMVARYNSAWAVHEVPAD